MMQYDMGTLYTRFGKWFYPQVLSQQQPNAQDEKPIHETLKLFNDHLIKGPFIFGEDLTIADISIAASLTLFYAVDFDMSAYPKVNDFYNACKDGIKNFSEINAAADKFKGFLPKKE